MSDRAVLRTPTPLPHAGLRAPATTPVQRPPCIDSRRLFGSAREVEIEHNGAVYRLKQTSLGKLILTK